AGGVRATLRVSSVSATGQVTGVNLVNPGNYTTIPTNPVTTTDLTTATAMGATFNLFANAAGTSFGPTVVSGGATQAQSISWFIQFMGGLGNQTIAPLGVGIPIRAAAIAAGGAGGAANAYAVGDLLQVQGGTPVGGLASNRAVLRVTAIGAGANAG